MDAAEEPTGTYLRRVPHCPGHRIPHRRSPHLQPLSHLPGVGPRVAEKLAARGLLTLQDLWLHLPLRYEDRTALTPIRQLRPGQPAQVEGRVEAVERGFRYRPVLRVAIGDESHSTLVLRFFHFRAAQVAQFAVGTRVRCYGTPKPGQHGLEIVHPSYRVLGDAEDAALGQALDPVYPSIEGIGPATIRKLIAQALDKLPGTDVLELLPPAMLQGLGLPSLRDALLTMHRPPRDADLGALTLGTHPAQRRLALEELLAHHLSLRRQRIALQQHRAPKLAGRGRLAAELLAALPFQLTGAQQRVFKQIRADLKQPSPMLRLVQGDVGSGKTVVAALAAMLAVEAGKQAALAAPTELLAEQHLANLRGWLEPLGVRVAWLAGKVTGKARARVLEEVASGAAQVVVGTHALMQEAVVFHDLALAIVDEQHRFGVHQRLALRDKGAAKLAVPHQLVMTATPIPRTLAMAAYADLDVSAIDELPPGRTPVQTVALSAERRPELIERIRSACAEGRQAYWVCTLIDDSEEDGKPGGNGNGRHDAHRSAGCAKHVRTAFGRLAGIARGAGAWAHEGGGKAGGDARLQTGRYRFAGGHHRDRSRRRCTERFADDHRKRRATGSGATAPAARPGRARRQGIQLRAAVPAAVVDDGQAAFADAAADQRRLPHCRKRSGIARARRTAGHAPDRTGRIPGCGPGARCRPAAAGAGSGRPVAGRIAGDCRQVGRTLGRRRGALCIGLTRGRSFSVATMRVATRLAGNPSQAPAILQPLPSSARHATMPDSRAEYRKTEHR
jgi:ATP-dependent DNA helicase RecG